MSGKPVSRPCDEMLEGPDHFRFADKLPGSGLGSLTVNLDLMFA